MADRSLSRPALKFASGELVFGYRLIRPLGKGSFGEVWLATNDKGFEWALKIVSLVGSGGKKEFRALQLIKDRKIKSTHLLKLIDYGLLDRDGTSLAVSPGAEPAPRIVPVPPPVPLRGTMIPPLPQEPANPAARTSIEQVAARDTQHAPVVPHDDLSDIHSKAVWLVIVMEVGDRTLHELQLEETRLERSHRASRATRIGNRSGTLLGPGDLVSKKQAVQTAIEALEAEEPLAPLPVAKVLTYIDQAARGLDYLHRHDILHRDVKPQNIMLIDADAKLCDYGLASEFRNSSATTEGCSPAYAAPEAINNRPVPASDQYSLAVTFVELVTGRWPFFGTTQTAIYREKDEGRHNLTFIRNRRTRQVLSRALAKHPEDRYPTCTQFAQELLAAENAPRRGTIGGTVKMLVAMCFLGLVAAAGFLFRDQLRDWFRRPLPPQLAEVAIDPVTTIQLATPPLSKLSTTPVSLEAEGLPTFTRSLDSPDVLIGQLSLSRASAAAQQPPLDRIVYVTPSVATPRKPYPLAERPLAAVPPLPKYVYRNADEELAALWAMHVNAPDDFLPRFVDLIGKSQRTVQWWTDLAARADEQPSWLMACERTLLQWDVAQPPAAVALRSLSGYAAFEQRIKDLGVARMLSAELKPSQDLARLFNSPAYLLNHDRPIAFLLKTDWELSAKASDGTLDEKWISDRLQQLSSLNVTADEAAHPEWRQFRWYVSAQIHSRRKMSDAPAAALEDLNQLLGSQSLPTWLGSQRKQSLARCIGRVAVANMEITASDLPRIDQRAPVASRELWQLQAQAVDLGLAGAEIAALQAVAAALHDVPDWRLAADKAKAALADGETKRLLAQHDRLLLLEYVAALAQLKITAADGDIDASIERFAAILQVRASSGPRFFDWARDQSADDLGVLRNLVHPVVTHPAAEKISTNHPQAVNLASLWGAKGRLLQRNPKATTADLQQAHEAFARARELDQRSPRHADYLVGYCTTFAPRPVLSLAQLPRDHQLVDLVKKLPSKLTEGKSIPANVALLQAHVLRMKGDYAAAATSYETALAAPSGSDPFHLRESALLNLCYVRLEQAQLAPWRETDLQSDPLAAPAFNTRSYYLSEALACANAAEKLPSSLQREQVYLAKGHALEQQAIMFGLGGKYGEAAAAYQEALSEAQSTQRPTAACRLSLARCYVTGFADPVLAGTRDSVKADRLQQAIAACSAVLDEKVSIELDEAKRACDLAALYWRGRAREELARLPDQPASLNHEAARDYRAAIRQGKSVAGPEVGFAYLALLRASKPASGTHDTGSILTAKAIITECLEMLQEEPRNFAPTTLLEIAEENRLPGTSSATSPAIVPFIQWFSASWPIPEPWTRDDDWRVAGARIASFASTSNANDPFRRAANDLAYSVQDPARKNLALSFLQHKGLSLQVKAIVSQQNKPASSTSGAALPTGGATGNVLAGSAGTVQLEGIFQRYVDCVQQAVDPVTRANLARLNRLPTEKLASEFLKLPPVQQRLIREYLTRGVTLEDRLRVWDLIESAQVGSSSGSSGGSPRLQQIAHDLVKPLHLLAHTGSDPQVAVRLKRIAASLKDAEEKLGIRPKDDPKDKTDKSKTPAKS